MKNIFSLKKTAFVLLIAVAMIMVRPSLAYTIYNPLERPNNFYGIHILFPEELSLAAKFANSSGGDWGYVTVPIQAGDKDLEKWQKFMDEASALHIIPIVRLMTEPLYSDTATWRKPNNYDIIDFANFLDSLDWPTKNRYVILYNEVNRFDEWGGEYPDPVYYTDLVINSYNVFKARDADFYLILGGLDNASVTDGVKYMNGFEYLQRMLSYNSEVFNKIDGFASHSYPNPGFSQLPNNTKRMGVATYKFEYDFINSHTNEKKLAFITETGWDNTVRDENTIGEFYAITYRDIWGADRDKVVAITPFLLRAEGGGPFDKFTFYTQGQPKPYTRVIEALAKEKGDPVKNVVYDLRPEKREKLRQLKAQPTQEVLGSKVGENTMMKYYFKALLRM